MNLRWYVFSRFKIRHPTAFFALSIVVMSAVVTAPFVYDFTVNYFTMSVDEWVEYCKQRRVGMYSAFRYGSSRFV